MWMEFPENNPTIDGFIMESIEQGRDWKHDLECLEFILSDCSYLNDNGTIRKLRKKFGMGYVMARNVLDRLPITRNRLNAWTLQ